MKHIDLDTQDERVKQFVLNLQLDPEGSILEADGKPVARVVPVSDRAGYDLQRLKQAILSRRDESRALREEWEDADREVWDRERHPMPTYPIPRRGEVWRVSLDPTVGHEHLTTLGSLRWRLL